MGQNLIDWEQINKEWAAHWTNRPPSYDLMESFHDFWRSKGGRDLYFKTDDEGNELPRLFLKND